MHEREEEEEEARRRNGRRSGAQEQEVRLAFLRSKDDVAPPPPHVPAAVEAARVCHPDRQAARSAKAATAKNNNARTQCDKQ